MAQIAESKGKKNKNNQAKTKKTIHSSRLLSVSVRKTVSQYIFVHNSIRFVFCFATACAQSANEIIEQKCTGRIQRHIKPSNRHSIGQTDEQAIQSYRKTRWMANKNEDATKRVKHSAQINGDSA